MIDDWVLLDGNKNFNDPHRSIIGCRLCKDFDPRFWLFFIEFINEVSGIISEAIGAVRFERVGGDWRNAHFPTVRERSGEQEMLHE